MTLHGQRPLPPPDADVAAPQGRRHRAVSPLSPVVMVLALWGYASLFGLAALVLDGILARAFSPGPVPAGIELGLLIAGVVVAIGCATPLVASAREMWQRSEAGSSE